MGKRRRIRHIAFCLLGACALGIATFSACSRTCPTSRHASERARWEEKLRDASPLSTNPNASISIKRDVHELVVGVDAATFAEAFHAVMRDPERRFGLIRVDRLPANVGKPFHVGERFQGRYELAAAGRQSLTGIWKQLFGPVFDDPTVAEAVCNIENGQTSDYGEIIRLELEAPKLGKYTMEYRYLSPSPIAGSSTFEVTDITDQGELQSLGVNKAALVRQLFVYQEQNEGFANFFSTGGLRLHNQVVYSQVMQAAEAAGTCIIRTDIPKEYTAEL
jgi:hypothetical protein